MQTTCSLSERYRADGWRRAQALGLSRRLCRKPAPPRFSVLGAGPVFAAGEEPTCGGPSLVAVPAVSCGGGKSPAEPAALLVLGQKVREGCTDLADVFGADWRVEI